jgi:ABC-type transport system substrate-binding protein/class 3 adenylate cyclase
VGELPSGTVTFLFTDVEGSTRLLHRLGRDGYAELLTAHREILLASVSAHEGRVVDTQGDSFFVAFRTAADAVAAAVDAQRDLAAHGWPEGAEVKVRMGLHTGEPKVGDERYVGIGVHRAARIGAAGHGGQVLLSSTTKELAEEDLPAGVSIRDLGERRLKDIEPPQRVYQLEVEGLPSEFGQLRTLDVELRRKRRRMYAGSALIGVLAAAVAIPVFALGQGGSGGGSANVAPNSLAIVDPSSNKVVGSVPNVGARPASIASGSGSLWVANLDENTVARVDPRTRAVVKRIPVAATQTALAGGRDAVWIANGLPGSVSRIDPRYDAVAPTIAWRRVPGGYDLGAVAVAVGHDAVWVANGDGTASRIDPARNKVTETVDVARAPTALAVGLGAVWVVGQGSNAFSGAITRIDPHGAITTIPAGHEPSAITVGEGAVWVAERGDDAVLRIDPDTNVTTTIAVGKRPSALAIGGGAVWVANSGDGTISRIDPKTNGVTSIALGHSSAGLAFAAGSLWATVQAGVAGSVGGGQGATERVVVDYIDYTDPALAYWSMSWQLEYATCAKLMNYPDKPAPAGSRLVPEVAQSMPRISGGGRTYTFTIRKGFRFSPPSNEPVTAQTFKYAIERTLSPRMHSPALSTAVLSGQPGGYLNDVVGEQAYVAGKAKHIAGVIADRDRLTIKLTHAAGNLPARLAMPFFCAVPLGTPPDPKGLPTISSAGPYYVASYTPNQQIVLRRNPNYDGPRPRHFKQIVYTIGEKKRNLVLVEKGRADYDGELGKRLATARLIARYGPGSPAARAGKQQLFINNVLGGFYFLALNTSRPLFADPNLRRAVSYAIERQAQIRYQPGAGEPLDHYLPPGMPGSRPAHIYPLHPDLAKARRLAAGHGGHAVLYTCERTDCVQRAQLVKQDLRPIGIDVEIKQFAQPGQKASTQGEPYDILADIGWVADFADPWVTLNPMFDGTLIKAQGNFGSFSYFNDPAFNRRLKAAAKLTGPERYRAYGQLDLDLARKAAPIVAYSTIASRDFFSARIGCQIYQPVYGIDLAALCIRPKK